MPVIGTAGHVDHGKSTLVQRLTGRDPDRWAEEKRRGLTIDLGFAWATLPDGTEVSFVDVPGHEKFLKNMLAGIESIDVALFVVAADEGWMPQSEEHLAVLDLLGVERAVVALTKIDLVDDELLSLALAETTERLVGTTLEGSRLIPVSATRDRGLDLLAEELVRSMPTGTPDNGRPRLWVDRSFPVAGAGTVVTGTLLDAPITRDDLVEVYPKGLSGRVRSIQSHEQQVDVVVAGRRVALNLGGVDHDEVGRGDMIGRAGQWVISRRFGVSVFRARFVDDLDRRGAYQLHIGSSAHRVVIVGLEDDRAVLTLDDPVPVTIGDRYILRDTGRKLVVAGGRVLDPEPARTRTALRQMSEIDAAGSPDDLAESLLQLRGVDTPDRLAAHTGGGTARNAVPIGGLVFDIARLDALASRAVKAVEAEHRDHPLRPGLPLATLAERLDVWSEVVEEIVRRTGSLHRSGPDISITGRKPGLTREDEANWQRAAERLGASLAVPPETDLGLDGEVISLKLRTGELVRIAAGIVYLPSQIDELRTIITSLAGEFTVAEFRDSAGLSRKYAVPILEWSDKEGLTVRRGDTRRVR